MRAVGIKTLEYRLSQHVRMAALLELAPHALARAPEPFPVGVRTLDALHPASLDFLRGQRQRVTLATYVRRVGIAAEALGFTVTAP